MVIVLIDEELKGAVALADIIREESKQAISKLKQMGIQCMMLTGDNRQVAKWVAEEIGLDDYFAEVLPKDKAEKIKEVQSRGLIVAINAKFLADLVVITAGKPQKPSETRQDLAEKKLLQ
ncbi:MAG: HAD-IC family P-type ATPase [Desulfohalobiaceae bacterium]